MSDGATLDAAALVRWLRARDITPLAAEDLNTIEASTEALEESVQRVTLQRDGWREIGTVLIRAAFGFEMRGFADTPPIELLDALKIPDMPKIETDGTAAGAAWDKAMAERALAAKAEAEAMIEALRDGLIGRAWRVGGHRGYGTCDYPLCAFRGKGVPLSPIALVGPKAQGGEQESRTSQLRVCHHPNGQGDEAKLECVRWAQYVAARARAGRIRIG